MRRRLNWFYDQIPEGKNRHHLRSGREVKAYLHALTAAMARGDLGLPHR